LNLFFKFDSHHSILFFISNLIFFIVIYFVLNFFLIYFFNSISHYLVDWKFNLVIFLGCLFMGWSKPYEPDHEFVKLDWVDFGLFFYHFQKLICFDFILQYFICSGLAFVIFVFQFSFYGVDSSLFFFFSFVIQY
jgi:hypothetical protein